MVITALDRDITELDSRIIPKTMDKIPCSKYQSERLTLLEYIKRLVNPDKKIIMAIIQPIMAVVVKG